MYVGLQAPVCRIPECPCTLQNCSSAVTMLASFVNRSAVQGINCSRAGTHAAQIVFSKSMQQPVTVCAEQPVSKPGKYSFEVVMPVKEGRTAIGFMSHPPTSKYMTPDYTNRGNYVSMGGAGFIYPSKTMSKGRYSANDIIRVELELAKGQQPGQVSFYVNDQLAGFSPWTLGMAAYPAISCANGEVICDIRVLE